MPNIYITEPNVTCEINCNYFQVLYQEERRISLHLGQVNQVILFGNIHLSNNTIKILRSHHIPILFFTQNGEYLGRLAKPSPGEPKYIIYQRQRWSNYQLNRDTAESIIWAKLHNQQIFLQGWTWYYTNHIIQRSLNYLKLLIDNLVSSPSLIELQEYSQEADQIYDRAITSLLKSHNPCPHLTTTRIRGLFNLADQLLQQYIYQLLNTAELDPSYGILSSPNSDEFSLARDLAAEFRPAIADDVVLNFLRNLTITNGQGKKHGQWLLQNFLQHWEAKLKTFILHPEAGEVTYRQCLDLQVRAYLACLLGDREYYRPLAFKHHPVRSHSVHPPKAQHRILALVK